MKNITRHTNSYITKNFPPQVIVWGGTGGCRQIRPMLEYYGSKVVSIFDDTPGRISPFPDVPIYQGWEGFEQWLKSNTNKETGFVITIGNPYGYIRLKLHEQLKKAGLIPLTVAHPSATIADNAVIEEGTTILAGAAVDVEVKIGKQCIISLNAVISHEDKISDGVEVGPGAVVCGQVTIGSNVWVASGAIILPRISIGNDTLVGAGAVVTGDVPSKVTVFGVPARILRKKEEQ
jgi:sugar O-acyltransferase (sialic acid O-acetyltransferase NeuD family)